MSLQLANVTFDCADTLAAARFWSTALIRPLDDASSEGFASIGWGGTSEAAWFFIKVLEPRTAKNRVHVDLRSDDRAADVARLVALGAQHRADHEDGGHRWSTLIDIEGNEFCVASPDQAPRS